MSKASHDSGLVWPAVLQRFEGQAPASVMARMALEHAFPAGWVDEVFEAHRDKQYARELLFSTVVELMTLVVLRLRPSLPASEKRLGPLRGHRGVALPGQSVVVYDPDLGLVVDLAACEDAHASERVGAAALLDGAAPRQVRALLCASTPSIPAWQNGANGTPAAGPAPAGCANRRSRARTGPGPGAASS